MKATCPKLNQQYPFKQKAGEPSNYVCDVYKGGESKIVDKVENSPGEEKHKNLNKKVVSAKVTMPINTGLTEKEMSTSTIVNAGQPLTGGVCSKLEPELGWARQYRNQ